ncbi:hypothetical protein O181_013933 [Austropuccinia psidii MF-1]|uniref:Uncharacterized protein n=1 Tax=Austropuccinia psidii MF-1 TaxID=1389203 RepID=A0A9Q3GNK6_9BASI|nr:hypothetical protein [Austropuccinia psidii MF-1]
MEKDPKEGECVDSKNDFKLYQQNNGNFEDRYKKGGGFEDLEEGELSENTQSLAGLGILELNQKELYDSYGQIFCFSNISLPRSTDLFNQNQGITAIVTNDFQYQNGILEDLPEYGGEEYYIILPMISFEELYYELDSPTIKTKYLS